MVTGDRADAAETIAALDLNAVLADSVPSDKVEQKLHPTIMVDRLRDIADALDETSQADAVALIGEANEFVARQIVEHERLDESRVYPRLSKYLRDEHGLSAMSRAHREILHLARLLARLSHGLSSKDADRYLIRDAQRVIESIESLVRIHNAQGEDIYEYAAASQA